MCPHALFLQAQSHIHCLEGNINNTMQCSSEVSVAGVKNTPLCSNFDLPCMAGYTPIPGQ